MSWFCPRRDHGKLGLHRLRLLYYVQQRQRLFARTRCQGGAVLAHDDVVAQDDHLVRVEVRQGALPCPTHQ